MTQGEIVIGAIGILGGGMVAPAASALWRKLSGSQYATRRECHATHAQMKKDCDLCSLNTKTSICAIQGEAAKSLKLMRLIAMKVEVPMEDLKEFL